MNTQNVLLYAARMRGVLSIPAAAASSLALAACLCVPAGLAAVLASSVTTAAVAAPAAPGMPLPTNSIYQLSVPLINQDGHESQLADWRGQPVLISMFYTSCEFVCPRIVEGLKRTENALVAGGNQRMPVLLVTFDPARDDVKTLKDVALERHLDDPVWTLARTDPRHVRKLAALLGIQYRQLPSGDFNHTSVLILLDAEGRIVGRTFTIGEADASFVKLAKAAATRSAKRK